MVKLLLLRHLLSEWSLSSADQYLTVSKAFGRFTPSSWAGVAQLARVSAFQAEGCGFETRLPLHLSDLKDKKKKEYQVASSS